MFPLDSGEKAIAPGGMPEGAKVVEQPAAELPNADRILSEIAGEQRLERGFVDEINAVQAALTSLEASHTFEGSGFLHDGTIEWGAEIDDLQRRLTAAENSLAVPTSSEGAF